MGVMKVVKAYQKHPFIIGLLVCACTLFISFWYDLLKHKW